MPIEKSAGAIIFRREGREGKIYYLLLHYPSSTKARRDYWDLPKGHIEKREEELETVKREVFEETGLQDIEFIEGFKEGIKYFFKFKGKTVFKIVIFYLAQTKIKKIQISEEHLDYKWLPYGEALSQLTYKNAKETLKKANYFLQKKSLSNS